MVPKVITEECRKPMLAAWGLMLFSVLSLFQTAHVEERRSLCTDKRFVYEAFLFLFSMILPLCMAVCMVGNRETLLKAEAILKMEVSSDKCDNNVSFLLSDC